MANTLDVVVIPDGPLKVSNAPGVVFGSDTLPADGDVYLCRCGQSSNAPFCDGTHSKVGFSGACESSNDKAIKVWEGNTLRTYFNPNTCMHVLYCKPLKALREAELAGDTGAAAKIAEVVETCPSGALTWEAKTDVPAPSQRERAPVQVMEGGEVRIQAPFTINADKLERMPEDRATLCRCGLSKNKPWCDGMHKARKDFR